MAIEDIIEGVEELGQPKEWKGESSAIIAAKFTGDTIIVWFKGGKGYKYGGCDQSLWNAFLESDSKGNFVSTKIKPGHAVSTV